MWESELPGLLLSYEYLDSLLFTQASWGIGAVTALDFLAGAPVTPGRDMGAVSPPAMHSRSCLPGRRDESQHRLFLNQPQKDNFCLTPDRRGQLLP